MLNIRKPLTILAAVVCAAGLSPAHAQGVDAHTLYETKCGGCHVPHAGDFVAQSVITSGEGLVGKNSNMPVQSFLEAGHGRLSPAEITLIMDHLQTVQDSGQLFLTKCSVCHGRAIVLSQLNLILKDDQLWGRYTDRKIEEFLVGHGRLTEDEIPIIIGAFVRQLVSEPLPQ